MSERNDTDLACLEEAQEALRHSVRQAKVMADDADKPLERHKMKVMIARPQAWATAAFTGNLAAAACRRRLLPSLKVTQPEGDRAFKWPEPRSGRCRRH